MDRPAEPVQAQTEALAQRRRRALAGLRLAMLLAVLVPTLAYVGVAAWLLERSLHDAALRLERSTRIANEHALKLFDTNEMLLQRMLDLLGERSDAALLADAEPLHERLVRMAAQLPQVQGLFVNGADARMLASSRVHPPRRDIDYQDRDWYQAHRLDSGGVYFTRQIVSRATGERAFDMSRRRVVDSRFAGTVHVSLRPEYLTTFYEELAAADPGLRMLVLRPDGGIVARWPDAPPAAAGTPAGDVPMSDPAMRRIAAGAPAASFDEGGQLQALRRIGTYPLYVVAALERADVVAAWRRQAGVLGLFVFPLLIGLTLAAWWSIRRTRAELQALLRLDDEMALRQRVERTLLHAQKLEAIGRLTGGVAHDFNNVLAVVSSNVEVLRRLYPEVAQAGRLDAMARAVVSGTKLTRQLLAFARKQALLPERVVLQERLPAMIDLLRPLLRSSIEVQLRVETDTAPVEVDAAELELALINLSVNAGDAMQGSGRLDISARNALPDEAPAGRSEGFVVIDVDDTGPGIGADIAAKVFDPFFTTKPSGLGTGLGLAQVSAFCHAAGGEAQVDRAPAGGARVRLLLARSRQPEPASVPAAPDAQTLQARILLVEDNDEVALASQALLEAMGARVVRVATADAALAFTREQRAAVDVVVSDIEMPGSLDGIELARRLEAAAQPLPVILVTGYAQQIELAQQQRRIVLPKPWTAAQMAERIRAALRMPYH